MWGCRRLSDIGAALLMGFSAAVSAADSSGASPPSTGPAVRAPTETQSRVWRRDMSRAPRPKNRCYVAAYPQNAWREVACGAAPNRPFLPRLKGAFSAAAVGNGTDYSSHTAVNVATAEGSFNSVTGVTSESGGGITNEYSLQLNTQFLSTSACTGGQAGCVGWEQFIFFNTAPPLGVSQAFIQYWLINYGSSCPGGWMAYQGSCYRNSNAVSIPQQGISSLGSIALLGAAPSGTAADAVTVSIGGALYSVSGGSYVPDLAQNWTTSEFNVFGPGNSSQAVFNAGSTLVVRTAMNTGTTTPATCTVQGFTAETNNLTLVGTPAAESEAPWPSIVFTESNAGNPTAASCTGTGLATILASATDIIGGQKTTLSVTPAGTGPFTYQWYVGSTGDTSQPITGATGASDSVSPSGTTSYWVLITGPGGLLQYGAAVTITVSPTVAPMPAWAMVLLGLILAGLGTGRRRQLPPRSCLRTSC